MTRADLRGYRDLLECLKDVPEPRRLRCSMHWPDPAQQPRIAEIRDNLVARVTEADPEAWLGEVEGLKVSLADAADKLAQINRRSRTALVDLGLPWRHPQLRQSACVNSVCANRLQ